MKSLRNPAIGKVIAEEILDGQAHSISIDPLRMERFVNAPKVREHNIFESSDESNWQEMRVSRKHSISSLDTGRDL